MIVDSKQMPSRMPARQLQEGLESLVIDSPVEGTSVDKTVLLVGDYGQTADVREGLRSRGYGIRQLPTLSAASQFLSSAYIDSVVADTSGKIPSRERVAEGGGYERDRFELLRFLAQVKS